MLAGMTQEQTNEYNRNHCKRIAKDLEEYINGTMYRCPDCGTEFKMPSDVGDKFCCPHCRSVYDVEDWEQLTIEDYISDCLDIEYRIGSNRKTVNSVEICVAWGGPNIYIDTADKKVKLYWGIDYAEYPLSYSVCDELDEWAEESWRW